MNVGGRRELVGKREVAVSSWMVAKVWTNALAAANKRKKECKKPCKEKNVKRHLGVLACKETEKSKDDAEFVRGEDGGAPDNEEEREENKYWRAGCWKDKAFLLPVRNSPASSCCHNFKKNSNKKIIILFFFLFCFVYLHRGNHVNWETVSISTVSLSCPCPEELNFKEKLLNLLKMLQ